MDIKTIEVNNKEYVFINEHKDTNVGFKHISKLYIDNKLVNTNSINYYNRTWESYTYQSIMKANIMQCIEEYERMFIDIYKKKHDIKRLIKSKREIALTEMKNEQIYKELKEVYNSL